MTKNASFYGLPTNEDVEAMINKNYDSLRPLEFVETENSNKDGKNMFAFWTPIADSMESYTDYTEYKDARSKKLAQTPKVTKWDADTTVGKIKQQLASSPIVLSDKTGVVKPQHASELNSTTTSKVDTETDGPKVTKTGTTGSDKALKTENHSVELPHSQVGVVKPKHDELLNKTTTKKQVTDSDIGVNKPKVDSDAAKPNAKNLVGIVKPKDAMGKQNMPMNFEKSKTSHIK